MAPNYVALGLAALSATASAFPTWPGPPACTETQQLATFDDIPAGGLSAEVEVPVPAGYKGLFFQAFDNAQYVATTGNVPGIVPHSGTNYAAINTQSQLRGTPMITTNFPSSNTSSFTLHDFYFGCVTDLQNTAAAAPAQCLVNIAGYRGEDNSVSNAQEVCSMQFQYNPSTNLGQQQLANTGPISGCKDLQFLIVTYNPPGGMAATDALLALAVDDFALETKSCH